MTLIFRLIIRQDIWIFYSKVFSSGDTIFCIIQGEKEHGYLFIFANTEIYVIYYKTH